MQQSLIAPRQSKHCYEIKWKVTHWGLVNTSAFRVTHRLSEDTTSADLASDHLLPIQNHCTSINQRPAIARSACNPHNPILIKLNIAARRPSRFVEQASGQWVDFLLLTPDRSWHRSTSARRSRPFPALPLPPAQVS